METGEEVSISCCDGCFLRSRRVPSRSQPQVRDYSHEMHRCIDLQILKWFEFSVLKRASTMDSTISTTDMDMIWDSGTTSPDSTRSGADGMISRSSTAKQQRKPPTSIGEPTRRTESLQSHLSDVIFVLAI
ncbi:hypothetical protein Y032_0549g3295 [Ancylostoma ceylanicum]|uniref:Uncharacterized protein n=1 Tax=Ancylostoma ceylanicum TaxID=53326 RepID=A0A016WRS8_9BILA|nr:hypothetical protein Y032_0549g3295 [Ancylostoma ceylanicum]